MNGVQFDYCVKLLRDAPVGIATDGERINSWLNKRDTLLKIMERGEEMTVKFLCPSCGSSIPGLHRAMSSYETEKCMTYTTEYNERRLEEKLALERLEALDYVRKEIGNYCNDAYWFAIINVVQKSGEDVKAYIKSHMTELAINAIGTDYVTKNGW